MTHMIHMEVDPLLCMYCILLYNPPKSKTTPLFGRFLFMDDHPFEATGSSPWLGHHEVVRVQLPALGSCAHGHPLTTTGSYSRHPRGTQQKQGKQRHQGTLQLLVVQLTTPATSCKQKGGRFGRNCHNPLGSTIWQSLLVPFPTLLAAPPPPGELPEIWMNHPRIHHQKILGLFFFCEDFSKFPRMSCSYHVQNCSNVMVILYQCWYFRYPPSESAKKNYPAY